MMLGMAPDYDHLMVIQKVEVFEHALDSTSGAALSFLPALLPPVSALLSQSPPPSSSSILLLSVSLWLILCRARRCFFCFL